MSPLDQHMVRSSDQQLHKDLLAGMRQKAYEGSKLSGQKSAEPCCCPWTPCMHMSSTFAGSSQQQLHKAMLAGMRHKVWELI